MCLALLSILTKSDCSIDIIQYYSLHRALVRRTSCVLTRVSNELRILHRCPETRDRTTITRHSQFWLVLWGCAEVQLQGDRWVPSAEKLVTLSGLPEIRGSEAPLFAMQLIQNMTTTSKCRLVSIPSSTFKTPTSGTRFALAPEVALLTSLFFVPWGPRVNIISLSDVANVFGTCSLEHWLLHL
jgi:hypothetical protein